MERARRVSPPGLIARILPVVVGGALASLVGAYAARTWAQADVAPTPARAGEASPEAPGPRVVEADGERYITMDFQDVDLAVLVKFMGEITGKNFVMDERVQGKVTVISPTRITPEEAYQVFQAVLQVKGFTTVPSGAAIRIIPTKDAKETSLRTLSDGIGRIPVEEYVTRLIQLDQVDAADMVPVLQPMVSKDGLISAYPQTNSIIVIDSAANVERLSRLVAELDVASSRRSTALIPLKHATAGELADTVQAVLEDRPAAPGQPPPPPGQPRPPAAAGGGGQLRAFKITPDDRTNTLIVNAAPDQMQQIRALVEKLDVPLPPGSGRINVYYLKYANAEDMLPVLLDVIGQPSGGRTPQNRPQQPAQATGSDRRRARGSMLRRNSQERNRRPVNPPPQPGQQGQQTAVEFAGEVRITADPATNALIISAAPEDFALLLGVIDKLDIRRRQVYVEAIILEVTLDRLRQIGIETQGAAALAQGAVFGRFTQSPLASALNGLLATPPAIGGGLTAGAVSQSTVTLPNGQKIPAQVALLTATENDSDINILSAPNILTTDNEEAEIIVGQNVPFVASRATSGTNLENLFATVEREDVGITLRLTPQISEGQIVRLALFQEVSAVVVNPLLDANEVGPTTTVRSASTTITVKDGQTVAIGGLISDTVNQNEAKIPYISDVPVIGQFFRNTNKSKNKINLLIFLTPHIIKDEYDAAAISAEERDRFREASPAMPQRHPDPLEAPTWELREDAEVPPAPSNDDDVDAAARVDGGSAAPHGRAPIGAPLALGDVTVDRRRDGAVIRLAVGGPPLRVAHYALDHPGRYVIDVYGPSAESGKVETLPVIDPLVRRVRVARHSGRIRIVLDLVTDTPPAYALEQHGGTIAITLGAARSVATKAQAAR